MTALKSRPGTSSHRLADGRSVDVHELATGDGRTIVFCHPAPGAGTFDPDPESTASREVTMIAVDRPGYGGSDAVTGDAWSTVDGAARDILAVLDARGLDRVSTVGWSAGGRVALALGALAPERVERIAVVATPAPHEEVPWVPDEQQAGLEALRGKPPAEVHAVLGAMLQAMVPADPASDDALAMIGARPEDAEILGRPGMRERLATMLEAAFAQGAVGMTQDIAGYCLRPWGFDLSDVAAKTLLVYGSADPIAGSRHGTWYQRQLPDARLEMAPGAGHLVVVPQWSRILAHLAPSR